MVLVGSKIKRTHNAQSNVHHATGTQSRGKHATGLARGLEDLDEARHTVVTQLGKHKAAKGVTKALVLKPEGDALGRV